MKKFVYLCGMMLLTLNMMAQIDLNDKNWDTIVNDDFTKPGRTWEAWSFLSSDSAWRAYSGSAVTHSDNFMVYQFSQCHFNDVDHVMELVAEYDTNHWIPINNYNLPSWMLSPTGPGYPPGESLYYFSGRLDYVNSRQKEIQKFKYGFFEIRCKLPIHRGAFPAFWLWDADSTNLEAHYEEIDIFEFSWRFEDTAMAPWHSPNPHGAGNPYCFSSGIYYCDTSKYLGPETSQARVYPMINDSLSHWHTFSCEWLPEHIFWYCDDILVDEYCNTDSIPHHALTLKTNYGIDRYALKGYENEGEPEWKSQDTMFIDYIKVYQLKWDCGTDETIAQQSELDHFDFAVKKSIAITSTIEPVSIGNNEKKTFRATDSFQITGPFQVDSGGEMTVIMQSCPE